MNSRGHNSNSRAGVISKRKIKTKERQISWQLHLYPWPINTLCTASGRRSPAPRSEKQTPLGCRVALPTQSAVRLPTTHLKHNTVRLPSRIVEAHTGGPSQDQPAEAATLVRRCLEQGGNPNSFRTPGLIFRDESRSPAPVSLLPFFICGDFVDKHLVLLYSVK